MPIIKPDNITVRGKEDARRHREKQREAIKKDLPHIIADESIITRKDKRTVKIPIRAIDIPNFRPKKGKEGGGGVGQGDGDTGDIIGKRAGQGDGDQPSKPGNEPGEDYIEAEVEIEEIIALMLEDLGLPNLEEKEEKQLIADLGFEIKGRSKSGPWSLLDARATAKEGIRRFWFFLKALESETKQSELKCFAALKRAQGIMQDALSLLGDPTFIFQETEIAPFPILGNDDLRFRRIDEVENYESQAVIIAMMDVSGSMGDMKKYLARSMLFWLTAFLRKIYDNVQIRFVIHHSSAKIVDEESFMKTGESGGTCAYTAYELARGLIETEYPTSQWNVYVWHFSDGDDFEPERSLTEMRKILDHGVSMLGYGEICPDRAGISTDSVLLSGIKKSFNYKNQSADGLKVFIGTAQPFLGVVIERKEHLLPALKAFLDRRRWSNE